MVWTVLPQEGGVSFGAELEKAAKATHCLCARMVLKMARLLMSNTCTRPASSPAMHSLPSVRISPLVATSLKREMVLTTRFVFGE